MNVYTYAIVFDSGSAPNYDRPSTTLAICKPRIRLRAHEGDLILGFSGARLSPEPNSVRWAGIVSKKLSFSEYWHDPRFQRKKPNISKTPDNIYRPVGARFEQVKNNVHDQGNAATDLGGEFVLVLGTSWVFGAAAPILPLEFGLRMGSGRRGHQVTEISAATWTRLKSWLDAQVDTLCSSPGLLETEAISCKTKSIEPPRINSRRLRKCR